MPDKEKLGTWGKLMDPRYLPTRQEVVGTFSFEPSHERGGLTDWKAFLEGPRTPYNIYECFTQEHISRLAEYLSGRIDELRGTGQEPITILDPCAGIGRLPYFLQQSLEGISDKSKFKIVAADDESWHVKGKPIFNVEKMDFRKAIQIHQPQIVVASWIPSSWRSGLDVEHWLDFFHQSPSIQEYILIGRMYWEHTERPNDYVPGYILNGFKRIDQPWRQYQVCFEDWDPKRQSVSQTVSFIRQPPPQKTKED